MFNHLIYFQTAHYPLDPSLAALSYYQEPSEFHEDIFGPAAPSFPAFSSYEGLPDFGEITASQSSMHELPLQHLGMGMQPSSATWSAQVLPSFNPIEVSVSNTRHLSTITVPYSVQTPWLLSVMAYPMPTPTGPGAYHNNL